MSAILFYDPACREPYDSATLHERALGGTEATLVRVADSLGAWVAQHNRPAASGRYLPPAPVPGIAHLVVARESRAIERARRLCPDARVHLWLHDQIRPGGKRGRRLAATAPLLAELRADIICVSDSQRRGVEATLRGTVAAERVSVRTVYNPIDDALAPDGTDFDPDKLVFFSSPNKGLHYALDAFRALRRAFPRMQLQVGNPGYKSRREPALPGVHYLGPQPQARMHAEVRSALCTFFPNFVIPETFGLVFAESHALGTPVLTHACGAALEVLGEEREVLPVTGAMRAYEAVASSLPLAWRATLARPAAAAGLFDAYVERIRAWREGSRPQVGPDPRFRLAEVSARWRKLLA